MSIEEKFTLLENVFSFVDERHAYNIEKYIWNWLKKNEGIDYSLRGEEGMERLIIFISNAEYLKFDDFCKIRYGKCRMIWFLNEVFDIFKFGA